MGFGSVRPVSVWCRFSTSLNQLKESALELPKFHITLDGSWNAIQYILTKNHSPRCSYLKRKRAKFDVINIFLSVAITLSFTHSFLFSFLSLHLWFRFLKKINVFYYKNRNRWHGLRFRLFVRVWVLVCVYGMYGYFHCKHIYVDLSRLTFRSRVVFCFIYQTHNLTNSTCVRWELKQTNTSHIVVRKWNGQLRGLIVCEKVEIENQ